MTAHNLHLVCTAEGKEPSSPETLDYHGQVNDAETVERIFQEYKEPLLRFISSRLSSEEDPQDILQETYIKVMSMESLDVIKVSLRAYLFKIATNVVRDHIRRKAVRKFEDHVSLEERALVSHFPSPEKQIEADQIVELIRKSLMQLDERCRNIFIMHRFKKMSNHEIAGLLGVSVRTVERQLSIAVNYCKCQIEKQL